MSSLYDQLETNEEEVIAHAYDLKVIDKYQDSDHASIHLWSLDRNSQPQLHRIENFPIFCHMTLPRIVGGQYVNWNEAAAGGVIDWLAKKLKDNKPVKWLFKHAKTSYWYKGETQEPMVLLMFKSIDAMYKCQYLVQSPQYVEDFSATMRFEVLETSISAVRKLFSLRNCRYAQFYRVLGKEVLPDNPNRISKPGTEECPRREFVLRWDTLNPMQAEETKGWTTKPRILSFDIETYSNNHRAFPDAYNAKHVSNFISIVYQRQGDPTTRKKYLLVIGDINDIPGVEIIRCKNEVEYIYKLCALINELDPEVITGFNILGYDYPFLNVRLTTKMRDWPNLSCLEDGKTELYSRTWESSAYGSNNINILMMDGRMSIDMLPIVRRDYKLPKYDLDTVSKKFLKRGKHDVKAKQMFVAYEKIMYWSKIYHAAVANGTMTGDIEESYAAAKLEYTRVGSYCVQDSDLAIDLFIVLNVWIGLVELASIVGVTIMELFTRGQQIRCLSQLYDLASKLGYVLNKRLVPKMFFNGGFVFEPLPGLYDNIICLDFASLYPSIMEAFNICFTTLVPPEMMDKVPDEDCHVIEFDQEEPISGAPSPHDNRDDADTEMPEGIVEDADAIGTEAGVEGEDKVAKTVMKHYKFKFVKQRVRLGLLPQLVHSLVAERNGVKGVMKVISKQVEHVEALLEQLKAAEGFKDILEGLEKRKAAVKELLPGLQGPDDVKKKDKAEMELKAIDYKLTMGKPLVDKSITDIVDTLRNLLVDLETQVIVLDKRQNALKVSANSMFGFLGAQNGGMMPLIEGAMCITAKGRQLITAVNEYLKSKYGAQIVYNDTDSSMVDIPEVKDRKEAVIFGKRLSEEISGCPEKKMLDGTIKPAKVGLFPPPLRMEFEKAMRLLCIKKKKYAAYLIADDGTFITDRDTGEIVIMTKGIVLARRDNCKLVRSSYMTILKHIMDRKPIEEAYQLIVNACTDLMDGKLNVREYLTIIRGLGSNYKQQSYFMKVFSDELRKMGRPAQAGDRLEYIVTKTQEELKGIEVPLGKKMRLIEMWEESQEYWASRPKEAEEARAAAILGLDDHKTELIIDDEIPTKVDTEQVRLVLDDEEDAVYPKEDIDILYYIEHALMNPIDQLFSIGYKTELERYACIGYQPRYSRCHWCSVSTPAKMIGKYITDFTKGGFTMEQITPSLKGLPAWFKENRENVDIFWKQDAERLAAIPEPELLIE
jgi:DNA polymerase elongation subunit (family B)